MKGAIIIAMMVVLVMVELGQALNCGQVDASLAPCVPYLAQGGTPPPMCCGGVKTNTGIATSTVDKKPACNCLKDAANRCNNLKDNAAQALPEKCGVKMGIPISQTTNCDALTFDGIN